MNDAQNGSGAKIGPVKVDHDTLHRIVIPGLLWQPLGVALLMGLPGAVSAADGALQYAKDLGVFPLIFLISAVVAVSVVLSGLLNQMIAEALYHWSWLHGRAWDRARRSGKIGEILRYSAHDLGSRCQAEWHCKSFYQRLAVYIRSAAGSPEKREGTPGSRSYPDLAADAIRSILESHVGGRLSPLALDHLAYWRKRESNMILMSVAVPVGMLGAALALTRYLWSAVCSRAAGIPQWAALLPPLTLFAGAMLLALNLRGYYHAQAVLAWVHGDNAMCRLFYAVWPSICDKHQSASKSPTTGQEENSEP